MTQSFDRSARRYAYSIALRSLCLLIPIWAVLWIAVSPTFGISPRIVDDPVLEGSSLAIVSHEEAWKRLPMSKTGRGQSLPEWARKLVIPFPKSTAALLQLDYVQRFANPIPPKLRVAMRWIVADENRCDYAKQVAVNDALQLGFSQPQFEESVQESQAAWSNAEKAALLFASKMATSSDSISDEEFKFLVEHFGDRTVACMVLHCAYACFQDRLLHCLACVREENDRALHPSEIVFDPSTFVIPNVHSRSKLSPLREHDLSNKWVDIDSDWIKDSFEFWQSRLEAQRKRSSRLRAPDWDEFVGNLPPGPMRRPSKIEWFRLCYGYAPELAVPFEQFMRTASAETAPHYDRIFGTSLFWVTTKSMKCSYCMGHCEMNWEVAGLSRDEIENRSIVLSSDDWSPLSRREQMAFAFARKLSATPWSISFMDRKRLELELGHKESFATILQACRYHYMTRISNGFQLQLEADNVFFDYWNIRDPKSIPHECFVDLIRNEEAWNLLPDNTHSHESELPNWAKALVPWMPRTTAAMLKLDEAHRLRSPLPPDLRAKLRWVVADVNRCEYSKETALLDLRNSGVEDTIIRTLTSAPEFWPEADRDPLEFARALSTNASKLSDEFFAKMVKRFGEKKVAAMVLLAAYGNFQDRFLLGFNVPLEPNGPLPALSVDFDPKTFQWAPLVPDVSASQPSLSRNEAVVELPSSWKSVSLETLQQRLSQQRERQPRLSIPSWEDVKLNLPKEMANKSTRIAWSLTCYGYASDLAIPWAIATRTHWAEGPSDRIFEESLFWIQTRAFECNYCMGHCEMLWEVAGLSREEIQSRSRRLAESDWSSFSPADQRAFAMARKLSITPWEVTKSDIDQMKQDLGEREAIAVFWWLCRGAYMTRVSDGFQLPLEKENVFTQLAK